MARMVHAMNMGDKPQYFDINGKAVIFNPHPSKNPSTWELWRDEDARIKVPGAKPGKFYNVLGPYTLKKVSDKPGPHQHYIEESVWKQLKSGGFMSGKLVGQDSREITDISSSLEVMDTQFSVQAAQLAEIEQKKAQAQAELDALQAQIKAQAQSLEGQRQLKNMEVVNKRG